MGVIQAIISFFQDGDDTLKCFSAGKHRFAVVAEGPLYLVAISSMGESDSQVYKFRSSISLDYSFPGKYTLPSLRLPFHIKSLEQVQNIIPRAPIQMQRDRSPSTLPKLLHCNQISFEGNIFQVSNRGSLLTSLTSCELNSTLCIPKSFLHSL
jgi:hypothetical protein